MRTILSIFSIAAMMTFTSCLKSIDDDGCHSTSLAPIHNATGPTTGQVGQPMNFEVNLKVYNGCGKFAHFEHQAVVDTVYIGAVAQYIGCNCTQAIEEREGTYQYQPTQPGTKYLRFLTSDTSYVERIVTIQ